MNELSKSATTEIFQKELDKFKHQQHLDSKSRGDGVALFNQIAKKKGKNSGFWEDVDLIVRHCYKRYPDEMRRLEEDVIEQRKKLLDPAFASTKDQSLRMLGSAPYRVWIAIHRLYGQDMPYKDKEFQRLFFKRYPVFRVADRI